MSKILTLGLALAALLAADPAQAVVLYEWTTTAFTIGNPDPPDTFDGVSMTLGLTDAAYSAGHLSGGAADGSAVRECLTSGIATFSGVGPLCPFGDGEANQTLFSYDLTVVGARLVGRFRVEFDTSTIAVASETPALWRGTFGADSDALGCEGPPCTVEGAWRRVSHDPAPVPEPGPLGLILVGLLMASGPSWARRYSRRAGTSGGCPTDRTASGR